MTILPGENNNQTEGLPPQTQAEGTISTAQKTKEGQTEQQELQAKADEQTIPAQQNPGITPKEPTTQASAAEPQPTKDATPTETGSKPVITSTTTDMHPTEQQTLSPPKEETEWYKSGETKEQRTTEDYAQITFTQEQYTQQNRDTIPKEPTTQASAAESQLTITPEGANQLEYSYLSVNIDETTSVLNSTQQAISDLYVLIQKQEQENLKDLSELQDSKDATSATHTYTTQTGTSKESLVQELTTNAQKYASEVLHDVTSLLDGMQKSINDNDCIKQWLQYETNTKQLTDIANDSIFLPTHLVGAIARYCTNNSRNKEAQTEEDMEQQGSKKSLLLLQELHKANIAEINKLKTHYKKRREITKSGKQTTEGAVKNTLDNAISDNAQDEHKRYAAIETLCDAFHNHLRTIEKRRSKHREQDTVTEYTDSLRDAVILRNMITRSEEAAQSSITRERIQVTRQEIIDMAASLKKLVTATQQTTDQTTWEQLRRATAKNHTPPEISSEQCTNLGEAWSSDTLLAETGRTVMSLAKELEELNKRQNTLLLESKELKDLLQRDKQIKRMREELDTKIRNTMQSAVPEYQRLDDLLSDRKTILLRKARVKMQHLYNKAREITGQEGEVTIVSDKKGDKTQIDKLQNNLRHALSAANAELKTLASKQDLYMRDLKRLLLNNVQEIEKTYETVANTWPQVNSEETAQRERPNVNALKEQIQSLEAKLDPAAYEKSANKPQVSMEEKESSRQTPESRIAVLNKLKNLMQTLHDNLVKIKERLIQAKHKVESNIRINLIGARPMIHYYEVQNWWDRNTVAMQENAMNKEGTKQLSLMKRLFGKDNKTTHSAPATLSTEDDTLRGTNADDGRKRHDIAEEMSSERKPDDGPLKRFFGTDGPFRRLFNKILRRTDKTNTGTIKSEEIVTDNVGPHIQPLPENKQPQKSAAVPSETLNETGAEREKAASNNEEKGM